MSSLAEEYGLVEVCNKKLLQTNPTPKAAVEAVMLVETLTKREFNAANKPPETRAVYKIGTVTVSTPGNLTVINAHVKAGKSTVINGMKAAALKPFDSDADTFTITSHNPDKLALLHFDTEQSIEDHWENVDRCRRRAGIETLPDWFHSYCLTGFGAVQAWHLVKVGISEAVKKHGGIHSIFLDGVADLVVDVNDPAECNAFVAELHDTAIQNQCPIICVIHLNPGTEKTRGHLGSQLERKAETNLTLQKDGEVTVVYSTKNRRAPIPKDTGPRFKWSDEHGMHVSCSAPADERQAVKLNAMIMERDEVFGDRPSMRYSEMVSTLMRVSEKSEKTCQRKIGDWSHHRIIKKGYASLYTKAD